MWVEFTADHDFSPPDVSGVTIAYKSGMRCGVVGPCALAAIGQRKARQIPTPDNDTAAQYTADPFWRPPDADSA